MSTILKSTTHRINTFEGVMEWTETVKTLEDINGLRRNEQDKCALLFLQIVKKATGELFDKALKGSLKELFGTSDKDDKAADSMAKDLSDGKPEGCSFKLNQLAGHVFKRKTPKDLTPEMLIEAIKNQNADSTKKA